MKWLSKNLVYIVLVFTLIIFITGFIKQDNDIEINKNTEITNQEIPKNYIYIDLKGEVLYPGVYKVEEDARLYEAVNMAGGFTIDADLNAVNLSIKLHDEDVIYIPNVSDNYLEIWSKEETVESSKININIATISQLVTLPGIGESTAQKIIDYRNEFGPFETIEDIKSVSGIGDATFEEIKDFITT